MPLNLKVIIDQCQNGLKLSDKLIADQFEFKN